MINKETPKLYPTQKEILKLFYKFRFLTIALLMKLLNHKNHHRIIEWLGDLQKKEYIGKYEDQEDKKDVTKPDIYYLETEGVKYLRTIEGIDKHSLRLLNREQKKKEKFIAHCFLVTEIRNHYVELAQEDKVHFLTRIEMDKDEFLPSPRPDAYIAIESNGIVIERYFLEIFDRGTRQNAIKKRIQQYLDYSYDGEWETQTNNPFPKLLLVFPDKTVKHRIFRFLMAILPDSAYEVAIFLSTRDAIHYHGVGKESWQEVKVAEDEKNFAIQQ